MAVKDLIEKIDSLGIMSEVSVRDWCQSLPIVEQPTDEKSLILAMINANLISKYQGKRLRNNVGDSLIVGNYLIKDIIGRGGMGDVYLAEHRHMKHQVAIKMLSRRLTKKEGTIKRFLREVEAAAKLSHDNIVRALDADQHDDGYYLVMEYVDGRDMAAILKNDGIFEVDDTINYISQAATGLHYAHSQGIIHRDIKPHNMLVDNFGIVKVLDMGLASLQNIDGPKKKESEDSLTQNNQIMGTADYMSPEQAEDVRNVDPRADIYSLGCSMYRVLVGKPPYEGESTLQKILAHREHPIPSLRVYRPEVPEILDQVLYRMLAKLPADRFQTMEEVIDALETCRFATATMAEQSVSAITTSQIRAEFMTQADGQSATVDADEQMDPIPVLIEQQVAQPVSTALVLDNVTPILNEGRTKRPRFLRRNWYFISLPVLAVLVLIIIGSGWLGHNGGYVIIDWPAELRGNKNGWAVKVDSNEVAVGTDNPIRLPIDIGRRRISLLRRGYQPQSHAINVEAGKSYTFAAEPFEEGIGVFDPAQLIESENGSDE